MNRESYNPDFFLNLALEISSPLNTDKLLQNVLNMVLDRIGIKIGIIQLLDKTGERLLLKAHRGIPLPDSIIKDNPLAIKALADGLPIIENNIAKIGKSYPPLQALLKPGESCSLVCCPLVARDKIPGLMVLIGSGSKDIAPSDLDLLKAVSRILGQAIEHARMDLRIIHQASELHLLQNINTAINSAAGLDEVLETIARGLIKVFGYTGSMIFLAEQGKGKKITLRALAYNSGIIKKVEKLLGFSLKGHIFEPEESATFKNLYHEQQPVLTTDISEQISLLLHQKHLQKIVSAIAGLLPIASTLSVPLVVDNRTRGNLVVSSQRVMDENDINRVQAFATQAALAIEKARLYEEESSRTTELSALCQVSNSISTSLNLREILQNTAKQMVKLFQVEHSGILAFDQALEKGYVLAEYPDRGATSESFPLKGYAAAERIIAVPKPLMIEDTQHNPLMAAIKDTIARLNIQSMLILPLVIKGKTIGSIGLDVIEKPRTFKPREIALGQAIADQVSIAIENSRLYEQVRESEERFRTLVEHANDWIWTLDKEGNFTFFNKAAEKSSGYKHEDWLGKSFAPLILPEDIPYVRDIFSCILEGNSKSYEVRVYKQNNELCTLSVNTAPLYEGNRIVGTVSMARDIAIQKQLEEQLREAQKMEALGTLAGGIAHDFNNILAGILGYVSFIKSELPQDAPLYSEIESISSLVERAAGLTSQLLSFARGRHYHPKPVNLNNIVKEIEELLQQKIDKAIIINTHLSSGLALVEGDSGHIQQMILNLCSNACDAMPEGGKLRIETANITIHNGDNDLSGLKDGSYVLISVSDTGTGINPEIKARMFDPFFTSKEGIKEHNGLGLSMVYGIAKSHSGVIKVESEVGQGTTFKIYLPAMDSK